MFVKYKHNNCGDLYLEILKSKTLGELIAELLAKTGIKISKASF